MKYLNRKLSFTTKLVFAIILSLTSCEREISNEAVLATYPSTADVYTDNPVGLTDTFFHSDNPADGANPFAFNVDNNVAYAGRRSIRFDVPALSNPNGGYVGGVFIDRANGRNLTKYDALTFYIKASRTVTSGVTFGFGSDYTATNPQDVNSYRATADISLSTNWEKITIPIPDPSKLTQLKGLFAMAAGTNATGGEGYIIWVDEIRFEKLGTIVQNSVNISNGTNVSINTFVGVESQVQNINSSFNLGNGSNIAVAMSPGYLTFSSSNPAVASVDSTGKIKSLAAGTSVITAKLNGNDVNGSVTINCVGNFVQAPFPTHPAANVISIFSDKYNNVPVNYYNGYWAPWQTTVSNDFSVTINGQIDHILNYEIYNFVGIEFSSPTVNATAMTHFHADFFFPGTIVPGRELRIIVVDFGANGVFGGGDDTRHSTTFTAPTIVSQSWVSINIPFSALPNLASRSNLGQIIFEGGDGSVMYVDNIYFFKQ